MKYNFNNDKATPEVFGFTDDDESWEIRNNTSNRVLWKSADFTGTDWLNDFEARHPEDNTDPTNLAALAAWLVSTDQSAATGDTLTPAVTYGDVTYTTDTAEYRLAKFKNEISDYLELDSSLYYYLFTELFLMVDSRAKNAFPTKYDRGKWCWLPYDMDTAIGTNNEGALVFTYELEDIDLTSTGADVYNGQDSVMWINIREAFMDELRTMYQKLRSDNLLSYEDTEKRFADHQAVWSAAIFNEDSYYKYLEPLFNDNTAAYLGMLQGSKAEQRKWWLYNRFRYIDSKYNAGDAVKDFITLRGYAKDDITVTPYADIYATIKYGSYLEQVRALRGHSYTIPCPLDNVNDTEIYIYSSSQLADVGDLSGLKVGYADFSMATKLQSLKLGDSSADYSNANLTELYLGNNTLLKTLDVRNCPNLGLGEIQQSVDISGCTNIEEVYFDGTAITGLTLTNGGILKKLHLPATITNLTLRNQTALTEFVMPSYSNITTLWIENASDAVDPLAILAQLPVNSRVRIIGFDFAVDSVEEIYAAYDFLDTMRGLDENGNNTDKPQVGGTIRIDFITGEDLGILQSRYPTINIAFTNITSKLYFYSEDGRTLLYTDTVEDVGNGMYVGAEPTKESTAQYHYEFAGWSKIQGGSADNDALIAITVDRKVYAAFTPIWRKYTVRFYNGNTLLQTFEEVPYGDSVTYTGETPVKTGVKDPSEYEFLYFVPNGTSIVGDTDCYAIYNFTGLYTVGLVERSISGEYVNDRIAEVGDYAFAGCDGLSYISLPVATSIGQGAFMDCSSLSRIDAPLVTTVGNSAFMNCKQLVIDDFGAITQIGPFAFSWCKITKHMSLPSVTSIGVGAFAYCDTLEMADLYHLTDLTWVFNDCSNLKTLILRTTEGVCAADNYTVRGTQIANGNGYIYVPAALVDDYKTTDGWSKYADQIRAIEDYPEICGGE